METFYDLTREWDWTTGTVTMILLKFNCSYMTRQLLLTVGRDEAHSSYLTTLKGIAQLCRRSAIPTIILILHSLGIRRFYLKYFFLSVPAHWERSFVYSPARGSFNIWSG